MGVEGGDGGVEGWFGGFWGGGVEEVVYFGGFWVWEGFGIKGGGCCLEKGVVMVMIVMVVVVIVVWWLGLEGM